MTTLPSETSRLSSGERLFLRCQHAVPVTSPSIKDAGVCIESGKIVAVGAWEEVSRSIRPEADTVIDLGEVIIFPGLINVHCHLDYTCMAEQVNPSPSSFVDWIGHITSLKGGLIYSHYAQSWLSGANMLLKSGTTTVADIEAVPELIPDIWEATPMRVHSFFEMTGVKSRRPPAEILQEALSHTEQPGGFKNRIGLSPHAPYSTTPSLLRLSADAAREKQLKVTTHVAESFEEFEMFTSGRGKMFTWLSRSERDMSDCGFQTPVQHLMKQGLLGQNFLAVHANYLTEFDIDCLARSGSHVVHCPRSHAYFGFQKFPYEELSRAGVNISLGTDSLASIAREGRTIPELDMFEEMRYFARANPQVNPQTILRMATVNGARALGMPGMVGELSPGAFADIVAVPSSPHTAGALYEHILQHTGGVSHSFISGIPVVFEGKVVSSNTRNSKSNLSNSVSALNPTET